MKFDQKAVNLVEHTLHMCARDILDTIAFLPYANMREHMLARLGYIDGVLMLEFWDAGARWDMPTCGHRSAYAFEQADGYAPDEEPTTKCLTCEAKDRIAQEQERTRERVVEKGILKLMKEPTGL